MAITRRHFTLSAVSLSIAGLASAESEPVTLRGKLTPGGRLLIPGGKTIQLQGDEQTTGVLNDTRLKDVDFEVIGQPTANGGFQILPIHKRAMFVHKDDKRLYVTYWCAVCSIRTYTPGICWCCQDETALDLKDKLDN